jgi:hypothetical protein
MTVPVKSYAELIALIEARRRELGLSMLEVDWRAGLQDGYFAKVSCGLKHMGRLSFGLILDTLGLEVRVYPKTKPETRNVAA